jgi:DNA-binding MarR family transcriptional regulator
VIVFAVNGIQQIGPLPPSAKLVYKVLENDGQLTQKDLVERTALPSRTVRYAIGRLKEKNLLVEHFYFIDARQSLYSLPGTGG